MIRSSLQKAKLNQKANDDTADVNYRDIYTCVQADGHIDLNPDTGNGNVFSKSNLPFFTFQYSKPSNKYR